MSIDPVLVLVFMFAGLVVSLDVTGLTLSKSKYFFEHPRDIFIWSISNAIWHSGLLIAYIAVISGLLTFLPDFLYGFVVLINYLIGLIPSFDIKYGYYATMLADSLSQHSAVILGIAALSILWTTYSDKIISIPSTGSLSGLSPLPRLIFNFLDLIFRLIPRTRMSESDLVRLVYWQAQAALVAVDMLALATLLKSMQLLEQWSVSFLVCIIVFVCVGVMAMLAGKSGKAGFATVVAEGSSSAQEHTRNWVLITMRLGEPFLIFYFALQLVAYLIFGRQVHSVSFFFAAGLLTAALVSRHRLSTVVERSLSTPPDGNLHLSELRPCKQVIKGITADLIICVKWLGWLSLAFLIFSMFLWGKSSIGLSPKPGSSLSLESELSIFMGFLKFLAAIFILFNARAFHALEDRMAEFTESVVKNSYTYLFVVLALFVAAIVPIHEEILAGLNSLRTGSAPLRLEAFGFVENHQHLLQISLWFLYLIALSALCAVINWRWAIEIADADSRDREHRRTLWRQLFVGLYVTAAFLLGGVGWLQSKILPAS